MKSRSAYWLLAALSLGVFVAVTGYLLRERVVAGKGFPPFSVYSDDRDGLAEAAYILSRLGYEPVALTRPVQAARHHGLLILVEPQKAGVVADESDALADADSEAVLRWVERGNTLLLSGRRNAPLHRALGVVLTSPSPGAPEDWVAADVDRSLGYADDIDRLSVERNATVEANDGLPLWTVDKRPGAVAVGRGDGRVIVLADPALLTARGLQRDDNVLFLANLAMLHARDGVVYFDEYHHGFRSSGGFWGYLQYHGQQLALLPILLAALAAGWHAMVRLGPATPTPPVSQADAVDYASALARLYQKTGARRLLGRALTRGFLRALTDHLRLRRTALPAEILAAWGQQHKGESPERLKALLKGVGELRKGAVPERRLLTWAREFDTFLNEMQSAKCKVQN